MARLNNSLRPRRLGALPWGAAFAALLIAPAWADGITERVSVGPHGRQSSLFGVSSRASISATGRFVAFESNADNLVSGDTIVADISCVTARRAPRDA